MQLFFFLTLSLAVEGVPAEAHSIAGSAANCYFVTAKPRHAPDTEAPVPSASSRALASCCHHHRALVRATSAWHSTGTSILFYFYFFACGIAAVKGRWVLFLEEMRPNSCIPLCSFVTADVSWLEVRPHHPETQEPSVMPLDTRGSPESPTSEILLG